MTDGSECPSVTYSEAWRWEAENIAVSKRTRRHIAGVDATASRLKSLISNKKSLGRPVGSTQ